jgi:hypothetical protein
MSKPDTTSAELSTEAPTVPLPASPTPPPVAAPPPPLRDIEHVHRRFELLLHALEQQGLIPDDTLRAIRNLP